MDFCNCSVIRPSNCYLHSSLIHIEYRMPQYSGTLVALFPHSERPAWGDEERVMVVVT